MTALPTRIDRYPAKMISHLASSLVTRYAEDASHLLDPFCGSGAILKAGVDRHIPVTGVDINPFGTLLTGVKLQGFDPIRASMLCEKMLRQPSNDGVKFPIVWDNKEYWFTPATLRKYEEVRFSARKLGLARSAAGRAVLLALGLSVRRCSRADQRSPKPFISKMARNHRGGRHFDPAVSIRQLLEELTVLYGRPRSGVGKVFNLDVAEAQDSAMQLVGKCSHVITSPPYINAQDYFRNFKLELYVLEGLLRFSVADIMGRFIGTERGLDHAIMCHEASAERRAMVPELSFLENRKPTLAVVVHRYLRDMDKAFAVIRKLVEPGGVLVIVCGDNLIGGRRICTWRVLNAMLERRGFELFDSFGDRIRNRALAPVRCGHKGLIKQEIVSAFRCV